MTGDTFSRLTPVIVDLLSSLTIGSISAGKYDILLFLSFRLDDQSWHTLAASSANGSSFCPITTFSTSGIPYCRRVLLESLLLFQWNGKICQWDHKKSFFKKLKKKSREI